MVLSTLFSVFPQQNRIRISAPDTCNAIDMKHKINIDLFSISNGSIFGFPIEKSYT